MKDAIVELDIRMFPTHVGVNRFGLGRAAQMEKIKTISRRCTSYGLKHVFERDTGRYVTNGAFICAAIHSGFDYKLIPGSPNVPFNISERSLNTVEKRLEGKRQ